MFSWWNGRKEIEEIVGKMKERDREEEQEWTWRNWRNKNFTPVPLPATRIAAYPTGSQYQLDALVVTTDRSKAMVLIMFILCVDLRLLVVGLFLFFCMFCHVCCLTVVFGWFWLALWSLRWGRRSWLLCFSLVCNVYTVIQTTHFILTLDRTKNSLKWQFDFHETFAL